MPLPEPGSEGINSTERAPLLASGSRKREMAEDQITTGRVTWTDLSVPKAEEIRDFYSKVACWQSEPVDMGGYKDFCMKSADGEVVAGICHARGDNAKLPPQWLIYIAVDDVEAAARECEVNGGKVIDGPREMGGGRCCVIRDPAGAVVALYEAG